MIKGKNIGFAYTTKNSKTERALNDVSFCIPTGRITAFMGKSGAGKTSLLSCITQLNNNYSGEICYQNQDIKKLSSQERASTIGFVSQQFNLFTQLTVLQNCAQPLHVVLGLSQEQAEQRAGEKLALLEIDALKEKYPEQLSGGQQQRVAIARALCFNPQAILFDEPTSALDPENTENIANIIRNLANNGIAIGVTSHDMQFVARIVDRLYFMQNGKIVEEFDINIQKDIQKTRLIKSFLQNL